MKKYICIHSHFYQPPRENPWIDKIQKQDSAAPFHNWNERISNECYRENGRSRINNARNYVTDISNNYSKINFNFGPTLLSWLENNDPKTYDYIIKGDMISVEKFNGHGNAIAQCYNHIIMPLANKRDKETQIIWGIKDFENRFSRHPEAMWLPETAVDIETLELLAKHKMKYIILAPRQASRIRKVGASDWSDVSSGNINSRRPYLIKLPSGAEIAAFFYDGAISKGVAFDGLLHNGEYFADRLLNGFLLDDKGPQLVHIATDGESYGHHHKFGDMALAFALKKISEQENVSICNYGYYLEMYAPTYEVKIIENSSWSCVHGIERWKTDCGCNAGEKLGWNQKWRHPLRNSLDELRDEINLKFEKSMVKFNIDPWLVRNDAIEIIYNRSIVANNNFLKKWIPDTNLNSEKSEFLKAFELQRQMQFMYTSCAWFFSESSGIETVQVLMYALRAIDLAEDLWGSFVLDHFLNNLKSIPSNIPLYKNGHGIYEKILKKNMIDVYSIGAKYAIESLFSEQSLMTSSYSYEIENFASEILPFGSNKILFGHAEFKSIITHTKDHVMFTALHLGEDTLVAGVSSFVNEVEFVAFKNRVKQKIEQGDFETIMSEIEKEFMHNVFTLNDLLPEDRYFIMKPVIVEKMNQVNDQLQQVFSHNYIFVSFLNSAGIRIPSTFQVSFEHTINERIINLFKENIELLNIKQLERDLEDIKKCNLQMKEMDMRNVFLKQLVDFSENIYLGNYNKHILDNFFFAVSFVRSIIPDIHLSEVQFFIFRWQEEFTSIPQEYESISEEIFDTLKIERRK